MLSLRLNLGIDSLYGVVQPPFYTDVSFDFSERTTGSLVLSEAISGNDAAVVGGTVAKFDGASNFSFTPVIKSDGVPYQIKVKHKFDSTASQNILGILSTKSRLSLLNQSRIILYSAIGAYTGLDWNNVGFTIGTSDFYDIEVICDGTYFELFIDSVSYGKRTPSDNSTALNLTGYGGYTEVTYITGKTIYINIDNEKIYYLNNNLYNSITGVEAINNGVTFEEVTAYTPASTLAALDGGYYQYPDWLRCTTSGTTYQASTQAYGVWEFEAKYLSLAANSLVSFVSSDILGFAISNVNTGYCVNVNPNGAISVLKSNNGGFSVVVVSSNGTISSGVSYDVKVERSVTGLFSLYLKTSSESTYTLIGSATDNTYTTSVYCVLNRLASDKIRNIKLTSSDATPITTELKLEDFTGGTGVYTVERGEQVITPSYTKPDDVVLHEGGKLHNLINSYICLNPTGSLDAKYDILDRINQTSASTDSVYYDSTDRITRSTYHISEMNQYTLSSYFNVGDKGKVFNFFDTNSIDDRNFAKEFLVYMTDKTNDDEIKILKYTGDIAKAIDDGAGSYVVDGDGYVVLTN